MFVLAQRSRGQVVRYTDAQARCMIKLLEKLNIIGIEREHPKTLARNETMSCLVAIGSLVLVVFTDIREELGTLLGTVMDVSADLEAWPPAKCQQGQVSRLRNRSCCCCLVARPT